ncbi:MAG: hypothetical protein IPN24_18380 [Betaproteobacteria bacterium]|nr:hypothetical protein [Betaproteobacteria bacterium]
MIRRLRSAAATAPASHRASFTRALVAIEVDVGIGVGDQRLQPPAAYPADADALESVPDLGMEEVGGDRRHDQAPLGGLVGLQVRRNGQAGPFRPDQRPAWQELHGIFGSVGTFQNGSDEAA